MRRGSLLLVVAAVAPVALWLASHASSSDRSAQAENDAIEAIASRALAEMEKRYPEGAKQRLRRDAHAKAHGCARGLFTVDAGLAADLRVATFAEPGATFRAWVRFSNGAFEPGSDAGLDGRGMAMKLLAPGGGSEHDFLAINYPQFFSPDAFDYRDFAQAGALTGDSAGLRRYFAPDANPFDWRIRQAAIAYAIASQKAESPLRLSYYSMSAYRFGVDRAVKFVLRPCGVAPPAEPGDQGPDYLRRALVDDIAGKPACFALLLQFRAEGLSVDDVTQEWPEGKSPFRKLGELTLPVQKVDAPARDELCEALRFTPWNAPAEMEPLGSLNRVRKVVYDAISALRHRRNGVPVPDPAQAFQAEGPLD